MKKVIVIALLLGLSSCAYYEQVVGVAQTYYDAKLQVWFETACTLNVGALGRTERRKRDIILAACPVQTAPEIEPE